MSRSRRDRKSRPDRQTPSPAPTAVPADSLELVARGLQRSAARKMAALLIAVPLVAMATWMVVGGRTLILPALVGAMPLLGLIRVAWSMRNLERHPLIEALRRDPDLITRVEQDVRPLGLIKWTVATSRLVQVELAGAGRHQLALPDDASLERVMVLMRARATRATIGERS